VRIGTFLLGDLAPDEVGRGGGSAVQGVEFRRVVDTGDRITFRVRPVSKRFEFLVLSEKLETANGLDICRLAFPSDCGDVALGFFRNKDHAAAVVEG
jgi:acyl dehydratase